MRGRDAFLLGAVGGLFFSMARFPAACGCLVVGAAILFVVAAVVLWTHPLLLFVLILVPVAIWAVAATIRANREGGGNSRGPGG